MPAGRWASRPPLLQLHCHRLRPLYPMAPAGLGGLAPLLGPAFPSELPLTPLAGGRAAAGAPTASPRSSADTTAALRPSIALTVARTHTLRRPRVLARAEVRAANTWVRIALRVSIAADIVCDGCTRKHWLNGGRGKPGRAVERGRRGASPG